MVAFHSFVALALALFLSSASALPATRSTSERGLQSRTFDNSGFYECIEFGLGVAKFCKCVQVWSYQSQKRNRFPRARSAGLQARNEEVEAQSSTEGALIPNVEFEIAKCTIPARGYLPVFLDIGGCCDDPCKSSCGDSCCTGDETCQSGIPTKPHDTWGGHYRKRDVDGSNVEMTKCPTGGDKEGVRYEYLDVKSNIESCGGCIFPDPASRSSKISTLGRDCTAIPHVADVACSIGSCIVKSCERGYILKGNQCVKDARNALQLQKYRL